MNHRLIYPRPLPYEQALAERTPGDIDLVVIHCTELPDLPTAREFGEKIHYPPSGTGHSGHYYIDRDGRVEQWVDPRRVAHHVRGYNERSIGIELVNLGRYPDWLHTGQQRMDEPYPDVQIESLLDLLGSLCAAFSGLRWITGHEDLDTGRVPSANDPETLVRRKLDPGPLFPWERVTSSIPLQRWPSQ
jgi:N-acetylmuramoyl-L-alanine amidase